LARKWARCVFAAITSRETQRWVIPKGWAMPGKDPHQAAAQEAWEEAGVKKAHIGKKSIGSFEYHKRLVDGGLTPCRITVYPLEVQRLDNDFPEHKERRRMWVRPAKAALMVDEPELKEIMLAL
jgi:8-oxo-dGTP pyrophosphatase MutT (NUDIX family)